MAKEPTYEDAAQALVDLLLGKEPEPEPEPTVWPEDKWNESNNVTPQATRELLTYDMAMVEKLMVAHMKVVTFTVRIPGKRPVQYQVPLELIETLPAMFDLAKVLTLCAPSAEQGNYDPLNKCFSKDACPACNDRGWVTWVEVKEECQHCFNRFNIPKPTE